ncbi:MAG TPA: DUF3667 domain-containing protein [Azospirillaceae bacterium]|nr:DUF3667 domain-containing protein [Azospirillaceae bacterium]
MSGDIEAAGGLATASLAAAAIDGDAGHEGAHAHGRCLNCGTPLRGAYCHGCGQSGHVHRSVLHLVEEFIHGILHFDGKAWRTLPMLTFQPGTLTHRYIHGQRARYVSPLALFLFSVFLMFFSFSFLDAKVDTKAVQEALNSGEVRAGIVEMLAEAQAGLDAAEAELKRAEADGADVAPARRLRDKARQQLARAEAALRAYDTANPPAAAPPADPAAADPPSAAPPSAAPPSAAPAPAAPAQDAEGGETRILAGDGPGAGNWLSELDIQTGIPKIDAMLRKALDNPEFLLYKMKNTAYKFAFLLIPLSLPFIWLIFAWKKDVSMYDHVIFSLYSLSFMSLLLVTATGLSRMGSLSEGMVAPLLLLVPPVHLYAHVKGTYRLGAVSALWRTVALIWIASIAFVSFVTFIALMGLAG